MKIASEKIDITCPESTIYNRVLSLDNKVILELGCGGAVLTRDIATTGIGRKVTAFEVDEIAHSKNQQITDLPNVNFVLAGAQDIPLADGSVDVVFMFKSLHHVPLNLMQAALQEINRVLKVGGFVYISEPIFGGEFNQILRLFHDEQKVREAAFAVVENSVQSGLFTLIDEIFFNSPLEYENFTVFENDTIKTTYGNHALDDDLYRLVKQRFNEHMGSDGVHFQQPIRVDLLQKPLGE